MNIEPLPHQKKSDDGNTAADMIRAKISHIYEDEPNAKEELAEAKAHPAPRSKHQQFMIDLSSSGKGLAEIQTEWHEYYFNLNDAEKHEVWQEFYAEHSRTSAHAKHTHKVEEESKPKAEVLPPSGGFVTLSPQPAHKADPRTTAAIKQQIVHKVRKSAKVRKNQHVQSLAFGLGMGALVVLVLLFGFFNERFIAPFITPSRIVSSTSIIVDPTNNTVASLEPKLIIPKINAEVPVVYTEPSIEEDAVQKALEEGVLHYATTPNPGETGNSVIFGHSSSNLLNKGKYKFAFMLLKQLELGDTFMAQKDGKQFVYKVIDKKIVAPTEVSVLDPYPEKPSTMTLITCDPPGRSTNRLIIVGEQISPDPSANKAVAITTPDRPAQLPSNSTSMWQRLTGWF